MPRVSICIPVYNLERYIAETLESVKAQTFQDYEAIIVDDGSTDGSAELIKPFLADPRFKYVHQENAGAAAARNTALRLARGEWFAFLDGDDIWLPDKLERQLRLVEEDPDVNFVYGNCTLFHEGGRERLHLRPSALRDGDILEWLYADNRVSTLTVLARTRDLRELGGMADMRLVEDYDLWLRLAHRGIKAGVCREPVARYRLRPGSSSSQVIGMLTNWIPVLQNAMDRDPRPRSVRMLKKRIRQVRSRLAYENARLLAQSGEDDVDGLIWESWRRDPLKVKRLAMFVLCAISRVTRTSAARAYVLSRLRRSFTERDVIAKAEAER